MACESELEARDEAQNAVDAAATALVDATAALGDAQTAQVEALVAYNNAVAALSGAQGLLTACILANPPLPPPPGSPQTKSGKRPDRKVTGRRTSKK